MDALTISGFLRALQRKLAYGYVTYFNLTREQLTAMMTLEMVRILQHYNLRPISFSFEVESLDGWIVLILILGLVKIARMALHKHYPKMTHDGFEALFSR